MPQFDIFSYFVQVFYVSLAFIFFYLFTHFYFLPKVSQVFKARKKILDVGSRISSKGVVRKKSLYDFFFKLK